MIRAASLVAFLALSSVSFAQRYTFIVTGDGRSAGMPGRAGYDENGVNKTVMEELVKQTLDQHAKFLMFSGDLVLGYTTADTFRSQLMTWRKIVDPLYDAGVHVYIVRGNHDAFSKDDEEVWTSVLSGRYAMPQNGPEGEKDATWSAQEENALLIGVDEWGKHIHKVNQSWLDEQLAKNNQPLIFVMGHEMAFKAGGHNDNLDNDPEARDRFIESLAKAGCMVYLCGHDHFYDRMEIDRPGVKIYQVLAGTAGAPFYHGHEYTGNNGDWSLKPLKHIEDTYGYILVKVDGKHVNMTFMGRTEPNTYKPMDEFAFTAR